MELLLLLGQHLEQVVEQVEAFYLKGKKSIQEALLLM